MEDSRKNAAGGYGEMMIPRFFSRPPTAFCQLENSERDINEINRCSVIKIKNTNWIQKARCFVLSENGASFAEYGLLITLIAIACFLAVSTLGEGVLQLFEDPRIETFLTGS
jgi:Flp pilus assembly pilin Flp